jgi:hypothetical protein
MSCHAVVIVTRDDNEMSRSKKEQVHIAENKKDYMNNNHQRAMPGIKIGPSKQKYSTLLDVVGDKCKDGCR